MENRYVFREVLSEIKDAADAAGNVITKEEIRERLKELPLQVPGGAGRACAG